MNDGAAAQVEEILANPSIAGTSALPLTNMGQGVFHCDLFTQSGPSLMLGGLQRLRERGMQAALVTGAHPGKEEKSTEFTSSRFVYEAVGFQLLCRTYLYHKVFATAV